MKKIYKILIVLGIVLVSTLVAYRYSYLPNKLCIQVLVSATHRLTGEEVTFGNPCSIPFWYKDIRTFNPVSTITDAPKVYSVKEVLSILATAPDNLKNKQIKIQAVHADSVRGLGCNDYLILMDKEDAERRAHLMDILTRAEMDRAGSERIREGIQGLPLIKSGETLPMSYSGIYPTEYGIYQGHFFDTEITKKCSDGNTRFIIDEKIQELTL